MTFLFHFEDKVLRRSLSRVESIPLLFLRLLCQVLEHMGFPYEPILERSRDSAASLTVDRWWLLHRSVPFSAEDQPTVDISTEEQPPPVEHFGSLRLRHPQYRLLPLRLQCRRLHFPLYFQGPMAPVPPLQMVLRRELLYHLRSISQFLPVIF